MNSLQNMSAPQEKTLTPIEAALMTNDLSRLTTEQRKQHYDSVCHSLGLNPLTSPFAYVNLNGKIAFYARKEATEQLRKVNGISCKVSSREKIDSLYVVTVELSDKTGRTDCAIGATSIEGLKGESLANAMMKAETKAKRRGTLSISGLAFLDETEVIDAGGIDCETKMKSGNTVFESIANDGKVTALVDEKMSLAGSRTREDEQESIYKKMVILGSGLTAQEKVHTMKEVLGVEKWDDLKKKTLEELKKINQNAQTFIISKEMKAISGELK